MPPAIAECVNRARKWIPLQTLLNQRSEPINAFAKIHSLTVQIHLQINGQMNIAAPQRFNHRTDQLRVLTQALKGQSHAIGQIGIEPGGLRRIRPFASGLAQGRHTSRPLSYCGSAFVLNDRYKRREFLCPVLHDALLSRSPVSPNPFMQQVCVHSMRKREASYRHARLQARFNQPALRLRIQYPTAISLHSDYWQSITYRFIHVLGCPLSIGWTPILRFYPAMRQVQKIERLRCIQYAPHHILLLKRQGVKTPICLISIQITPKT